jgi:hypothetical protein
VSAECTQRELEFHASGRREVLARFDGGEITSDGGALLLRETERRLGILRSFAACFKDHRNPRFVEHTAFELVAQRVLGIALGYEDLNDHDVLRRDRLIALAVGKRDLEGAKRRERDRGYPLAGKSTLNRLELTSEGATATDRYKKIECDFEAIDRLLVHTFIRSFAKAPQQIVLDLDATDATLHGKQEERFFHGYYDSYCYLPLYIFRDDQLLCARLRPSNIDGAAGALDELAGIVAEIREAWPAVKIIVRADSGFCRDEIMTWCEDHRIDYVFGLARNPRLEGRIQKLTRKALRTSRDSNEAVRFYRDFTYRTRESCARRRRVIGKAEATRLGSNPRFIVTSLAQSDTDARALYEDFYCARGDMENRIKEQKRFLFADRLSTHHVRSNQIQMYFSAIAYVLMSALRRIGLAGTAMATAQCDTIRLRLLKIGALVRISFRRVVISFASGCPYATIFTAVYDNLCHAPPG